MNYVLDNDKKSAKLHGYPWSIVGVLWIRCTDSYIRMYVHVYTANTINLECSKAILHACIHMSVMKV